MLLYAETYSDRDLHYLGCNREKKMYYNLLMGAADLTEESLNLGCNNNDDNTIKSGNSVRIII